MWCHERSRRQPSALAGALSLATAASSGWVAAAEPPPPSLKVSGSAAFVTEARATTDGFEVRATLSDEVGRPLPGIEIRGQTVSPDSGVSLFRCGEGRGEGSGPLLATSDAGGRVCFGMRGMTQGSLELSFEDRRGYLERASVSVRLPESANLAFEVGFDPPLGALSLDQPLQRIGVLARSQHGSTLPDAAELVLSIAERGTERELTRVALDGLGELHRLSLVSASFGAPGPARIVARLRGRGGQEHAQASAAVLRTATVVLGLEGSAQGVEPGGSLALRAATTLGPVPSGVVEARSEGRSVAAARIQNGQANLTLPAATLAPLGKTLSLEFVGDSPGWLAGPPLEVALLAPRPSYARSALWIVAAILIALAVVLGWRRPPRARPSLPPPPPRSRASVEVIESFGTGGGYRGVVCDAHDATPISPAALSFIAPGPGGTVLLQVRVSQDGSFTIDTPSFPDGTLVEVTAPFHATLSAPLPGPGVLQLSLVSRRRALLNRLVHWAERRGKPWTRATGDPTPAHVAGVADQESELGVGRWARAVEQRAYGPNPPDSALEQAAGVGQDPKLGREQ
jgi:hypothetical protein